LGRILGKGSIGYVPGVDGQACTKLERVPKEARESSKDFDMFTFTSVADQADIGATCIIHSCILIPRSGTEPELNSPCFYWNWAIPLI